MGERLGLMIGAVGGLVFVLVNAGAPLDPLSIVVRVVGVAAFLAVVWFGLIRTRHQPVGPGPPPAALRTYWICVVGEVIAIVVGAQILVRVLGLSQLTLVWVVLVVGVHFLPFATAFRVPLFTGLGWALIAVAVIGGVVTLLVDPRGAAWTGVVAGFVLLAFCLAGAKPRSGGSGPSRHVTAE